MTKRSSSTPRKTAPKAKASAKTARTKRSTTSKRATKPKTKKTTTPRKKKVETVELPQNMSQRAITKSLTYTAYFKQFATHASLVAAGLCMLAGSTLALYASFTGHSNLQVANVCVSGICPPDDTFGTSSTGDVTSTQSNTTNPDTTQSSTQILFQPSVQLIDPLPATVSTPTQLRLAADNTQSVTAKVEDENGTVTGVGVRVASPDLYYIDVPGDQLSPSQYVLSVRAEDLNGISHVFSFGVFDVPPPTPVQQQTTSSPQPTPSTTSVASTSTSTVDTVIITPPTPTATPVSDPNLTSQPAGSSTTDAVPQPGSTAPVVEADQQTERMVISSPSSVVSGVVILPIVAPIDLSFIEVYVNRFNSASPQFVGLADKSFGYWRFVLDSSSLPNADYLLYTTADDPRLESSVSNSLSITVQNRSTKVDAANSSVDTTTPVPAPEVEPSKEPLPPEREEAPESPDAELPPVVPTNTVSEPTQASFSDYENEIEQALEQYAVSVRAGDESLVAEAEDQLKAIEDRMIAASGQSEESGKVIEEVTERFESLKENTNTIEQLRKQKSDVPPSDSDGDGITDSDEINLYGTDPRVADTDRDGFTDGIEIIRGFDPTDADPEAAVDFELPTEVKALVREDVINVDWVEPLVRVEQDGESSVVESIIRGTALPNSFVTLYIFSTPIVVTVQTDADGAFEFTLNKELADGTHDVYAAITDNTGSIVAQSQPFSFIKEASAYTPLQSDDEVGRTNAAPVTYIATRSYVTTIGLAVLTFGVLLFFIGTNLRRRRQAEVKEAA